jgi:hypothetical protein
VEEDQAVLRWPCSTVSWSLWLPEVPALAVRSMLQARQVQPVPASRLGRTARTILSAVVVEVLAVVGIRAATAAQPTQLAAAEPLDQTEPAIPSQEPHKVL